VSANQQADKMDKGFYYQHRSQNG